MAVEASLQIGFTRATREGLDVVYRFLLPTDVVEAITHMLHEAYAPLAEAGLRFVASYQDSDVTRRRFARGDTVVALSSERIIGIVTLAHASSTSGSSFSDRANVFGGLLLTTGA